MLGKGAISIWYVIYCPNHREENLVQSCRQHLSREALKDVFYLTYDKMRRYQGAWHTERQQMFPHYIFLESDNEERLRKELEEYREFVTILEDREILIPVQKEEEQLLRGCAGKRTIWECPKDTSGRDGPV